MSAGVAKYRQVADDLRQRIKSGEYAPGAQLPTEPELGEHYSVSRTTVRDAVAALRDEGVVTVEHGRGVFVSPPKKVERLDSQERLSRARREQERAAFLAEAASQGFAASVDARVRIELAGDFAAVLGTSAEDEVCVRDRTQRADGKVVQLAVSRLPRSVTAGTALEQVETGQGGAYARLAEAGYEPTEFEEIVGAGPATAEERQLLDVQVVLRVRRLAYAGNQVVEVNDMTMPADSYELRYRFTAV